MVETPHGVDFSFSLHYIQFLTYVLVLCSPADLVHWGVVPLLLHHQFLLLSHHRALHWIRHSLSAVQLVLPHPRAPPQLPCTAWQVSGPLEHHFVQ